MIKIFKNTNLQRIYLKLRKCFISLFCLLPEYQLTQFSLVILHAVDIHFDIILTQQLNASSSVIFTRYRTTKITINQFSIWRKQLSNSQTFTIQMNGSRNLKDSPLFSFQPLKAFTKMCCQLNFFLQLSVPYRGHTEQKDIPPDFPQCHSNDRTDNRKKCFALSRYIKGDADRSSNAHTHTHTRLQKALFFTLN